MMHTWFECKVRYDKQMENGVQKRVSEPYLIDALSFTEAESRIIEEMTPYMNGEFSVANIKRANFSEITTDEIGDKWYKCKIFFVSLDEKSGSEKRIASYILVQASDFASAFSNLNKAMESTSADWEIASINETPIMDVFPYKSADDVKPEVVAINE